MLHEAGEALVEKLMEIVINVIHAVRLSSLLDAIQLGTCSSDYYNMYLRPSRPD